MKFRIPSKFTRPMPERKFRQLQSSAVSREEKNLLESCYKADGKGKWLLQLPEQEEALQKLSALLKIIHKSRRGLRLLRVLVVLVIVLAPVVFSLFFLDSLAARKTEALLEKLTQTDVTVENLDISLLKARADIGKLAFADPGNDMQDVWVFDNVVIDGSWKALAFRRFVADKLRAGISYRVARSTPARYPEGRKSAGPPDTQKVLSKTLEAFEWFPVEDLPTASLAVAAKLRGEAEARYRQWNTDVRTEEEYVRTLVEKCRAFIAQPQPGSRDVAGWAAYIQQAKKLLDELNTISAKVERYGRRLEDSAAFTKGAVGEIQRAVESDLAKIEAMLTLDPQLLERWLTSAIEVYIGPRMSRLYSRGREVAARIGAMQSPKKKKDKPKAEGRMKKGRVVYFPVIMPPRLSIRSFDMGGEGISVVGENVGIDHHLAGSGSHLQVVLDGAAGVPGRVEAAVSVDERDCADYFVQGNLAASGLPWNLAPTLSAVAPDSGGESNISGRMTLESLFYVPEKTGRSVDVQGQARVESWKKGSGYFAFIDSSAPPLGFHYRLALEDAIPRVEVGIGREYVGSWLSFLAASFLPAGISQAQEALRDKARIDIGGLESLLEGWNSGKEQLLDMDESLDFAREELQKILKNANIPVKVPASGDMKKLLGGLGLKSPGN